MPQAYETLYPETVDPGTREFIRGARLHHSVMVLDSIAQQLGSESAGQSSRERALAVVMQRLLRLASSAPDQFHELHQHWGLRCFLSVLGWQAGLGDDQVRQLELTLGCLFLPAMLRDADTEDEVVTAAQFWNPLSGGYYSFATPPASSGELLWRLSNRRVQVFDGGDRDALLFEASLPIDDLRDITPLRVRSLPVSRYWKIPVVESIDVPGLAIDGAHIAAAAQEESAPWQPLGLMDSVDRAYGILSDLWPEVVAWGHELIPAIIDMNGPVSRSVHRSSSHGPHSPIMLTPVEDPFTHAEDIVHELQHQRLYLFLEPSMFPRWDNSEQRYVSPYRSDARPLKGLHLGLHAFLSVNELRLRRASKESLVDNEIYQLAKTHRLNLFSFSTIAEFEEPSAKGKRLLTDMAVELVRQHALIRRLARPAMDHRISEHLDSQIRAVMTRERQVANAAPAFRSASATLEIARHWITHQES